MAIKGYYLTYGVNIEVDDDETPEEAGQRYLQSTKSIEPMSVELTEIDGIPLGDPDAVASHAEPHIVIMGDPTNGFNFYGPFVDEETATSLGPQIAGNYETWWTAPLITGED